MSLNPAQQQTIAVGGAVAPLTATLDQKLVTVSVSPDSTQVTITATQATGTDTLHLADAAGAQAGVAIRVAFNAGTIVPQTTLTVTGDPADPVWLARQAAGAVARLTQSQPGTQTTIAPVTPPPDPLAPGATMQFAVPVQIGGNPQFFDQTGTTTVNVVNRSLPPFVPDLLFYDDDPEHVTQDGVLFRGTVAADRPTRLYYYHDAAEDTRRLVVALTSAPQDAAEVHVVDAPAGPNADVMQVGHAVTRNFLLTKARGQGVVVDLSGDAPYLLADVTLTARQLAAGAVDLRVLSGGPVVVTVLAVSPGVDPRTLLGGDVLPGDGHHRTGIFAIPGFGDHALTYLAGGADAALVIGDTDPTPRNTDAAAAGHDYGDYGVVHTLDLTLSNPGASPATAYLFFRPIAGPARGAFLIDGSVVDVGCVRAPVPYQITSFDLAPGQTQRTVVQTMTDGGSFYPVQIGVSATAPRPTAPPISSPDGCFPKPEASAEPQ